MTSYLLGGQPSEVGRLQLQSLVWEPSGRALLAGLPGPRPRRALDLGCGCLGWLRILSDHVGAGGEVVGTDIDSDLLARAQDFLDSEGLLNVTLLQDDLFRTALTPGSFDLVHARFQVAPLGRGDEIVAVLQSLVAPGGTVVLEDPDSKGWTFHPAAPATEELVRLVVAAFGRGGGDFDAGRDAPRLLRSAGLDVTVRTDILAPEPGHPYLTLPLHRLPRAARIITSSSLRGSSAPDSRRPRARGSRTVGKHLHPRPGCRHRAGKLLTAGPGSDRRSCRASGTSPGQCHASSAARWRWARAPQANATSGAVPLRTARRWSSVASIRWS
jgi:SAM-dependent methyltransferase